MNAHQTITTQRVLLDRLFMAGCIPYHAYLATRNALAEAPAITCAYHSERAAAVYAADETTPLCAPCAVAAYERGLTP